MRRERKKERGECFTENRNQSFGLPAPGRSPITTSRGVVVHFSLDELHLQSVLNSTQEQEEKDHRRSPGGNDRITISSLPESTFRVFGMKVLSCECKLNQRQLDLV